MPHRQEVKRMNNMNQWLFSLVAGTVYVFGIQRYGIQPTPFEAISLAILTKIFLQTFPEQKKKRRKTKSRPARQPFSENKQHKPFIYKRS